MADAHDPNRRSSAPRRTGPRGARSSRRARRRGLKHGFFDYSIACEIVNGGKRQLVIRAGKTHKFTIPEDEVPR